MRTATTLAKLHPVTSDAAPQENAAPKSPWILLAGPDVSLPEQQKHFQSLLGIKVHEKYSEVRFQEDGYTEARVLKFLDPAAAIAKQEAQQARQKANDEERAKIAEDQKKREGEAAAAIVEERQTAVDLKNAATASQQDATGKPTAAATAAKQALDNSPRMNRGKNKEPAKGSLENPYIGDEFPSPEFGKDLEFFGNQKTSTLYQKEKGAWRVVSDKSPPTKL